MVGMVKALVHHSEINGTCVYRWIRTIYRGDGLGSFLLSVVFILFQKQLNIYVCVCVCVRILHAASSLSLRLDGTDRGVANSIPFLNGKSSFAQILIESTPPISIWIPIWIPIWSRLTDRISSCLEESHEACSTPDCPKIGVLERCLLLHKSIRSCLSCINE